MRSHRFLVVLASAVTGAAALVGCSDEGNPSAEPTASSSDASTTATSSLESHTAAPGAVGQAPGGATTAVGAPAESTEEEYSQACVAAKEWMTAKGGDPKELFEPYLADVQSSDSAGPGTFGTPWSQLAPGRQAAVIVAAEAAANDLCG
jgi:hypothetical protein